MRKSTSLLALGALASAAGALALALTPAAPSAEPEQLVRTAPAPASSFRDVACPQPESIEMPSLEPMSWWAPALGAGASFAPSFTLPVASTSNDGIIYGHSEEIGSEAGASLLVGHVDLEPGVLSAEGGELTSWGQLHRLEACDLVFAADEQGQVVAGQVVSVYTAPQFDESLETRAAASPDDRQLQEQLVAQQDVQGRIFRSTGPYGLVLLTCSGPSVADVGGDFQFRYSDNLVVEVVPVEVSQHG